MSGRTQRVSRGPTVLAAALTVLAFALSTNPVRGQLPMTIDDSSHVALLTVTPGSAVYSAFGHSALRITDPASGLDAVFNYGTFDASDPYFVPKFAYGDMQYFLSVYGAGQLARGAELENRTVISQSLALRPAEVQRLYAALRVNAQPENRTYLYDFIRDNCSTRLLDMIEGQVLLSLPDSLGTPQTFRQLIDGYVHRQVWLDLGIDLVLGANVDETASVRERVFLPIDLMKALDGAVRRDTGQPIVAATDTLLSAADAPELPIPPGERRTVWLTGVLWGAALLGILLTLVRRTAPARLRSTRNWLDGLLTGIAGFAGLFLLFMWFGTKHTLTANNWNLLWALPSHLIAVVWIQHQRYRWYAGAAAALTWAVILGHLLSAIPQSLPPAALPVAVLLAWRLTRRAVLP